MTSDLTAGRFARFYAPLAATSLLLTATNPILAAALARTPAPANALAGYSVAFALTGVLYSPLLVMQQVAANRLLRGGDLEPVRRFAMAVGLVFSFLGAAMAFSPLGLWVFQELVGVTGAILEEARSAMALLWPTPFLTGLRALHQGRLVAGHRTHPIAVATGVRTGILGVVAFALTLFPGGAWLGAAAFTAGLLAETLLVGVSPAPTPVPPSSATVDDGPVILFSTPLMLNVLLWWSTPLILNSVLARTPEPDCALASFAVVEAVAWFVTAPVGQLHHAGIALVDGPASHRRVRGWGGAMAVAMAAVLAILALPSVREPMLRVGFELDPSLLRPAARALPLAVLYPLLYAHRQYYQGLFVRAHRPGLVGLGAVLRVGSILAVAPFALGRWGMDGAALGVGLAVTGLVVEGIFLERLSHRRALPRLETVPPAGAETVSA